MSRVSSSPINIKQKATHHSKALAMRVFVSVALTALASTVNAATFDWDCTNALGTCQNYCFYAQCRGGAGQQFTFDSDTSKRAPRRQASGCSQHPCSDTSLSYSSFGDSCDEFPFASTKEGGSGARLRCVDKTDNNSMSTLFWKEPQVQSTDK